MTFPVYVLLKDIGEIVKCASVSEIQYHFERIDVEDGELITWDATGSPVILGTQEPVWISLKTEEKDESEQLKRALLRYAQSVGIEPDSADIQANRYEELFKKIASELDKQQAAKGPLGRILGRRMKI